MPQNDIMLHLHITHLYIYENNYVTTLWVHAAMSFIMLCEDVVTMITTDNHIGLKVKPSFQYTVHRVPCICLDILIG